MMTATHGKSTGFTLIEVLIVVAIIALLAAIAYPSYIDQVRKARRGDGHDTLLNIRLQEEKWRANNTSYTNNLTKFGYAGDSAQDTPEGWYKVSVSGASETAYLITAAAQNDQVNDDGCTSITINQDGNKSPAECW